MTELDEDKLPLFSRVYIPEIDTSGSVYERFTSASHTIYGVKLDKIAHPKNFIATEVWHCKREELEVKHE
jgi:hypothetical protein